MLDVVVVGSCVQDLVSFTPRFPKPGESVRGTRFLSGFGGKGANQAIVAARLGARTGMIAKVGSDIFGIPTVENFRSHGINAEHVHVTKAANTATATVTVSESGENSIVVILGANLHLTREELFAAEALIADAQVLCCQLEINQEVTAEALKIAKAHGVVTILNPAPGMPNLDKSILKFCDVLCPNVSETEILCGYPIKTVEDAEKATKEILELGPELAIVTLGAKGCVFGQRDGDITHVSAPAVTAVDTTGAGDAFVGALAFFLATRKELSRAEMIRRASHVAAHSVQFPGTQTSYPYKKDLDPKLFE